MRQIHARLDARVTSANPTKMLRALAVRGAHNKGCYFWTSCTYNLLVIGRKGRHVYWRIL
jgi:hypothetical protein